MESNRRSYCLCHTRTNVSEILTHFTERSWETFSTCAKIWLDAGNERFSELARETEELWSSSTGDGGLTLLYQQHHYHRSCYQDFTNSKSIGKALKRSSEGDSDVPPIKRKRSSPSEPTTRVFPRTCIFHLSKTSKLCGISGLRFFRNKQSGSRQQESLTQCLTLDAAERLKRRAEDTTDERLMLYIRDKDLIAAEACYHKSYYNNYFKVKVPRKLDNKIIPTSTCSDTPASASSHSEAETTGTSDNETSCPPHRPVINETQELYHAAQVLRECMSKVSGVSWPPTSGKLDSHAVDTIIPLQLHNFIAWMIAPGAAELGGEKDKAQLPDDILVRLQSIAQDLIYAYHKGRVVTPKHVALGVSVRHLTRSAQTIGLLNKFGHTVSHSYLQELDTAVATKAINEDHLLPPNINATHFTTAVWDNIDLSEETLSGKGTTHHTNGILVQRPPEPHPQALTVTRRTGERSYRGNPQKILPYFNRKKVGPDMVQMDVSLLAVNRELCREAEKIDFVWMLLRLGSTYPLGDGDGCNLQTVPGWSGFNASNALGRQVPQQSTVGYLPCIPASPTDMSTVYTLLTKSVDICTRLNQDGIVVVLDQAIYCKALQILWREKDKFARVVLRLGAFHTTCVMLAVVGKRFDDAGLRDVLTESGIVAQGSINGIMTGKHYNRAVRIFKIVYEAIQRMRWQSFLEALPELGKRAIIEDLHMGKDTADGLLHSQDVEDVYARYEEYCSSNLTPMFSYWSSFIDLMQIILNFIRATRTGDFELHLASIRAMLPWMFAYDRTNYMRYCSVYWLQMMKLHATHPSINQHLHNGDFVVQRSKHNPFGQIACDMAIEQTFNKDTKSSGGIVGFSLKAGAVERWTLSSPERAATVAACRELAGMNGTSIWIHKDQSRLQRDEEDVVKVMNTFKSFVNPFTEECEQLIHLTSGYVPSQDITSDLLTARQTGEERFMKFIDERLVNEETDFFAPLPKLRSKTFKSTRKVVKVSPTVSVQEDRHLFGSILAVNNKLTRQINLEELFEYSLGTYPYSLTTVTGGLAKTNKAKLLEQLEKDQDTTEPGAIRENSAWIYDGMAVLQQLVNSNAMTFGEFGEQVLDVLLSVTKMTTCQRIDFVPDRYLINSIKSAERGKRGSGGNIRVQIMSPEQKKTVQWKKFLSCDDNKEELVEFLFGEWCKQKYAATLEGITLVVAHSEKCHSITSSGSHLTVLEIPSLKTTQEEADTRLFLHAAHASLEYNTVVVRSPDTDVAVIGISHCGDIMANIYMDTGVRDKRRIINLDNVAKSLGPSKAKDLVKLHAFTGCDTISSFYGKGKSKSYNIFLGQEESSLSQLGNSLEVTPRLLSDCEKFVCHLYGSDSHTSVNKLRYEKFIKTKARSECLPPNQDSLQLHVRRANYQAYIWTNALNAQPYLESPFEHGWRRDGEDIAVEWMKLPPAPKAIMELMSCKCKRNNCSSKVCPCRKHELQCTDACKCKECSNQDERDDISSDDEEGSDDEDEDAAVGDS